MVRRGAGDVGEIWVPTTPDAGKRVRFIILSLLALRHCVC